MSALIQVVHRGLFHGERGDGGEGGEGARNRGKSLMRWRLTTMAMVARVHARAYTREARARECALARLPGRRPGPAYALRARACVTRLHPLHPRQEVKKQSLWTGEGVARLARVAHG